MADDIIPLGPKFEFPVETTSGISTAVTLATIKTPTNRMCLVTYSALSIADGTVHQAMYAGWQLATTRNGSFAGTAITPTCRDGIWVAVTSAWLNASTDHTYASDDYLFSGIPFSSLGTWEQRGAFWINPDEIWSLKLQQAPSSCTIAGTVCFHEIGGATRTA